MPSHHNYGLDCGPFCAGNDLEPRQTAPPPDLLSALKAVIAQIGPMDTRFRDSMPAALAAIRRVEPDYQHEWDAGDE